MIDVFSRLSDDGRGAMIEFEEDGQTLTRKVLDAAELSIFITPLGRLRAAMADKIPRELDARPVFTDVMRTTVFHVNREHRLSREFFVAVRHEGFGWLAFMLNQNAGEILAGLLVKQASEIAPKIIKPPGHI